MSLEFLKWWGAGTVVLALLLIGAIYLQWWVPRK